QWNSRVVQCDVCANRCPKKVGTLSDNPELLPHGVKVQSCDVDAVIKDAAGRGLIKAKHEFSQCGFAGSGWTNYCYHLSSRDLDRDIPDSGCGQRSVPKRYLLQLDAA